jgi:hypothetical protein
MMGLSVDRLASLGAGAAVFQEPVAGAQLSGLAIGAEADEIFDLWPIPSDLDPKHPLRFRYWFSHGSTDADVIQFKTFYKFIGKLVVLSAANSSPEETLAHADHTVSTTADVLEITDWIESVSDTKIATTDFAMLLACEVDDYGSASANELTIFGIEIEYTIKATDNDNQRKVTEDAPIAPNQFAD